MEERKYWLAFNNIYGLGAVSIMKIYKHFKSLKYAWSASSADFHRMNLLTPGTIEKIITNRPKIEPERLIEETEELNIKVCCLLDDDYPAMLKEIYNPPVVLYYKGELKTCDLTKTIAIVGTRAPSEYGRKTSRRLAKKLSGYGVTIVSGLAEGIDTCAHTACIQNEGKTIAVLGSGLNQIFPKINIHLAQRIHEGNYGAVISEYSPNTKPEAWRFPYRNRIISGLSKGTIVVESKARGGALITAKYALEQNREVFGVPSRIIDNSNAGTHNLIQRSEAKILTSYTSLFDDLNWELIEVQECAQDDEIELPLPEKTPTAPEPEKSRKKDPPKPEKTKEPEKTKNSLPKKPPAGLSETETLILNCFELEAIQFDQLLQKTQLKAPELLSNLTLLELKGLLKQLEGKRYIKSF